MTLLILIVTLLLFIFTTGLCVGSFLNVVILRALSEESIVFPGSKCPSCQTKLKWYHNIPLLSYVLLKGKCAFCKEHISFQYPIIELLTGLMFVGIFFKFDLSIQGLFAAVFGSLFIVLAVTDIREKVIFDFHSYILVVAGLIFNFFNLGHYYLGDKVLNIAHLALPINNSFIASVLGIFLGVLVMEFFARTGYLLAGTRAFGEGDSYIAAALGAIFGWKYLLLALFYSFIIQIVFTLPVFIKKMYDRKDYLSLGSFTVFLLLIYVIKMLDYYGTTTNLYVFGTLSFLLLIVGYYFCKRILGGLKDKDNMTYLPFGPAMVIAGFILMFTV